jgi:hypothetical protein
LRFKIFHELKMIIQGIFAGMRVLVWAIVLLFVFIYFVGLGLRMLIGPEEVGKPELRNVPSAMFTLFRCITEGCMAYDGTPLTERLRDIYGAAFFVTWMVLWLFVSIGIFNLIMAVFLDNCLQENLKKKLSNLGAQTDYMRMRIQDQINRMLINPQEQENANLSKPTVRKLSRITATERQIFSQQLQMATDACAEEMVTREVFNIWLKDPEMLRMLEDVEIDTSANFDLFDVLDADLSGELSIEETVEGLMLLRGPVTKNDIISIRMKMNYLVAIVEEMHKTMEEHGHYSAGHPPRSIFRPSNL